MKKSIIIILFILTIGSSLFLGSTYYYLSPFYRSITDAVAVVHPTKGNTISGVVTFEEKNDGLHITANLSGLKPGKHGFHIHEFGDCNCDDAMCAGSHFNPTHAKHGAPDENNSHIGDLGNITADENGTASYNTLNKHAKLNGPYSIIGRSVIVHEKEDDLKAQPTGDAGGRIGCGVIGMSKKSI